MKTKKTLTRLYLRAFLLALPFLILATIYVVNDPFMVIKNYADYDHPAVMIQSEGPIGWYKYKKYRDSIHYDSFILGSSCTMSFQSSDWKKHIKGNVFRLFSNSEGLGDLVIKLEALERQPHQPIRNLLIVAEPVLLNMTVEQRGVMHVMPPDVSGRSMAYYQSVFLQGFFRKDFFVPYINYLFTKKYDESMHRIINNAGQIRTKYENDEIIPVENVLDSLGEKYYEGKEWDDLRGKNMQPTIRKRILYAPHIACLKRIKAVCNRKHTKVKIAIGPELTGFYLNPTDEAILKNIFGAKNVVNYNCAAHAKEGDYHNFYDHAHYRIGVGRRILDDLYKE